MKRKNPSKLSAFFAKHRLFRLTLILFLVVFPILLISSIHFYQSVIVKPVLFEEKTNKLSKNEDLNYFDIEAELVEIKSKTETRKQRYVFEYEITKKSNILTNINVTNISAQLSPKFDPFNSPEVSLGNRMNSDNYSKLEIEFDFDMEASSFPFLKTKGPILYLKIDFVEESLPGVNVNKTIILKIDYTISDNIIKS